MAGTQGGKTDMKGGVPSQTRPALPMSSAPGRQQGAHTMGGSGSMPAPAHTQSGGVKSATKGK